MRKGVLIISMTNGICTINFKGEKLICILYRYSNIYVSAENILVKVDQESRMLWVQLKLPVYCLSSLTDGG